MPDLTNSGIGRPPAVSVPARRAPAGPATGENLPAALRLLPAEPRRHLVALHRYVRHVDQLGGIDLGWTDPGGRPAAPAARVAALDAFEAQLLDLFAVIERGALDPRRLDGLPPALAGLAGTVARCRLPVEPLRRLIEANRRDQLPVRYPSWDRLLEYCHLSADPVGELVLHVFGAATAERIELSDCICTALRIVQHLQDVPDDHRRGRVYLPAEDLARFGVCDNELAARHASGPLRCVLRLHAGRAEALLDAGAPLLTELRGWARAAVAGYLAGGRAALAALHRSGYDPMSGPPRPRRTGIAGRWVRAMVVTPR
ncbi:squalene/phytoene synthase family protein [Plantactinospora siamensis]|uniref:Squalene/phytoene synthase family protein n=1 Tax=Plantactinospora siamensis TaxID=555372 RepID=A0ABV6P2L3_9ACTN